MRQSVALCKTLRKEHRLQRDREKFEKENLFKFIDIELNFNNKTKSVIDLIIHELDHAYDDYQQYKNNGTTYQYKYIKSNYKLFDMHKGDDEFTKLVRAINYIFIKFETHAYITQIRGEINKKFNKINHIIFLK